MTLERRSIMTRNQRSVVCPASVFAETTPDKPPACPVAAPRSTLPVPSKVEGHAPRASAAFTVLELLVVISIIAILLGVILPSFLPIRDKAKRAKAQVTAKNLEIAFKNYLDYYRKWPSVFGSADTTVEINDNIFRIMRGETVGGDNASQVVFYEFETSDSAAGALDPWSDPSDNNTWRRYRVRVDADFNNTITLGSDNLYRSVVVWSCGTNRVDDDGTKDDIKSWE